MSDEMEEVGAALGETQRFECKVIGFPTPTIRWFKDGIDISKNLRYENESSNEHGTITLVIKNLTLEDEGMYQCKAENSEGSATTMTYLSVKMERTPFSFDDYSLRPVERKIYDDELVRPERRVVPRYEDIEQEIVEDPIPPKITYDSSLRQAVSVKSGSTLFIEVNVSGQPRPLVNWYHGDSRLLNDSRVAVEMAGSWVYLKVKSISEEDAGSFKVTAENSAGFDSAEFRVVVKVAPSPPRDLRVVEVFKDYIVLAWSSPASDGGEKITGYEIEKSLSGASYVNAGYVDGNTFQYKVVRLRDKGDYMFRVSAENRIGKSAPTTTQSPVICKLPFDPPGPPKNICVHLFSKDFITISWQAPETDGGSKIIQYVIEKSDVTKGIGLWMSAGTASPTEFSFKASKLFQGNAYLFRIRAENRVGVGPPVELAEPAVAHLPFDQPSPPRNIRAVETDSTYIVIEWDAPDSDGGSPITGYTIEKKSDAKRDNFILVANCDASTTKCKVTRLFEGGEYWFRVFAENQAGLSLPCQMVHPVKAKPPYDEPDAPRNLRVKEYWTDYITVVWDAPENDGGSPITSYVIEKREASRPVWVKAGTVGSEVWSFKAISLFEGAEYLFRVFAVNRIGQSKEPAELSQSCRAKMPFDPPFAPRNLKVVDYNINYITLTWEPPEHDGGSAIAGYTVEKRDALMNMWTPAGKTDKDTHKFKVVNLFEGQSYLFRVAAENQCGRGAYAETLKPTVAKAPFDTPSKPRNLRVTDVWKDYVTLLWEEPEMDGGSPVTGYTIEMRDAYEVGYRFVAAVDADTTQFQVTNLQEGHEYYIRIYSQNAAGLSEQPGELKPPVKAKLPYEVPSSPSNFRVADVGDGLISVAWDAPNSDGGSPVTGYLLEVCRSGSTGWTRAGAVDGSSLTFDVGGLIVGDYYFIRCFAENLAGFSKRPAELGEPVCAKKPTRPPDTPTNLRVTNITASAVTLSWDPPSSDGSSDVAQYFIDMKEEKGLDYTPVGRVDGRINSFTSEFLQKGRLYRFRVRAKNSAGFTEPCELPEPVELLQVAEVPSPPSNLRVTGTDSGVIAIAWDEPKSDGGSPLTGFIVETCRSGLSVWTRASVVAADKLEFTIDGLMDGECYFIRVFAENQVGISKRAADLGEPVCAKKPTRPPGTPVNLRVADVTSNTVTISWDAPQSDGSCDVAQYFIDMKEEDDYEYTPAGRVDGRINSFTTEFLRKGKLYRFRVRAKNSAGYSEPPADLKHPVGLLQVAEVPSAPTNLRVTDTNDGQISIAWDTPKSDGGSPVTGYIIESCQSGTKGWTKAGKVNGTTLAFDLSGLIVGENYYIRVFAENQPGISKRSADLNEPICAKKPTKPPGTPTNLRVTDVTNSIVTIHWDAPASDGSCDVAQYYIDVKEEHDFDYTPLARIDGRICSFTTDFLRKGKRYRFRVRAKNSAGFSEPPAELVNLIELLKDADVPSSPQNLRLIGCGDGQMSVEWDVPNSDGGLPITGYVIESCRSGSTVWTRAPTVDAGTLTANLSSLSDGNYYFVRVFAENPVGLSKRPSEFLEPILIKKTLKPLGTPSNLRATSVTSSAITVSWDAPPSDGSADVAQYIIDIKEEHESDYTPAGRVDGRIKSFTTEFLQKGKLYRFRVRARNSAGISEPPAELINPVQLLDVAEVPSAPINLRVANTGDGLISMEWDAPKADGGSPITGYKVEICQSESAVWSKAVEVSASCLTCELTGLMKGSYYFVRVYAQNEAGLSRKALELLEPVRAQKPTKKPHAPSNLRLASATTSTITINWDSPPTDFSSEVGQYLIEIKEEGSADYVPFGRVDGRVHSFTAEFLHQDKSYNFQVKAKNASGVSEPAELQDNVELTKIVLPEAPVNLRITDVTYDSISLAWDAPKSDGGAPIKRYIVVVKEVTKKKFKKAATIDGRTLSCTINSGIEENQEYLLRVYAENEVGIGNEGVELEGSIKIPSRPKKGQAEPDKVKELEATGAADSVDSKKVKQQLEPMTVVTEQSNKVVAVKEEIVEAKQEIITPKKEKEKKKKEKAKDEKDKEETSKQEKIKEAEITAVEVKEDKMKEEKVKVESLKEQTLTEKKAEAKPIEPTMVVTEEKMVSQEKQKQKEEKLMPAVVEEETKTRPENVTEKKKIAEIKTTAEIAAEAEKIEVITDITEQKQVSKVAIEALDNDAKKAEVAEIEAKVGKKEKKKKEKVTVDVKDDKPIAVVKEITEFAETKADIVEKNKEFKVLESAACKVDKVEVLYVEEIYADKQEKVIQRPVEKKELKEEKLEKITAQQEAGHPEKEVSEKELTEPEKVSVEKSVGVEPKLGVVIKPIDTESSSEEESSEESEIEEEVLKKPHKPVEQATKKPAETAPMTPKKEDEVDAKETKLPVLKTAELPSAAIKPKVQEITTAIGKEDVLFDSDEEEESEEESEEEEPIKEVKVHAVTKKVAAAAAAKVITEEESKIMYETEALDESTSSTVIADKKKQVAQKEEVEVLKIGKEKLEKENVEEEEIQVTKKLTKERAEDLKEVSLEEVTRTTTDLRQTAVVSEEVNSEEAALLTSQDVRGAPRFEEVPYPLSVKAGETIRLTCKVTGHPQPDIKFYKGDERLQPKKKDKRLKLGYDVTDDLFVLEIKNAVQNDGGEYMVTASNLLGSIKAVVSVQVAAADIWQQSLETSEQVTETVDQEIAMEGGRTVVASTVKERSEITKTEIVGDSWQSEEVSVEAVISSDRQSYVKSEVYASGILVDDASRKGEENTDVNDAVQKPKLKEEIVVEEFSEEEDETGEGLQKETVITKKRIVKKVSKVKESVEKKKDKHELMEEEINELKETKTTTTTRTITEGEDVIDIQERTRRQDFTAEEEVNLEKIGEKPVMLVKPESTTVSEGETIVLKCQIKGVPEPEVKWYKGENRIKPSKSDERIRIDEVMGWHTLEISSASIADSDKYTVKTINEYGSVKISAKVEVRTAVKVVDKTKMEKTEEILVEEKKTVMTEQKKTDAEVKSESLEEATCSITLVAAVPENEAKDVEAEETIHVDKKAPVGKDVDASGRLKLEQPITNEDKPQKITVVKKQKSEEESEEESEDDSEVESKVSLNKPLVVKEETKPKVQSEEESESEDEDESEDESQKESENVIRADAESKIETKEEQKLKRKVEKLVLEESAETITKDIQNVEEGVMSTMLKSVFKDTAQDITDSKEEKEQEESTKATGTPPKFIIKPEPAIVPEGNAILLQCKVEGIPEPDVKWYKGEEKLKLKKSDKRLNLDYDDSTKIYTLEIRSTLISDSAKYTVKAVNEFGSVRASAKVEVVTEEAVVEKQQVEEKLERKEQRVLEEVACDLTLLSDHQGQDVNVEGTISKVVGRPGTGNEVTTSGRLKLEASSSEEEEEEEEEDEEDLSEMKSKEKKMLLSESTTVTENQAELDEKSRKIKEVVVVKKKKVKKERASQDEKMSANDVYIKEHEVRIIRDIKEELKETEHAVTVVESVTENKDFKKAHEAVLKREQAAEFNDTVQSDEISESVVESVTKRAVTGAPVIVRKPESVTVDEGSTICLQCQVEGEPIPEVTWHKGKKQIKKGKDKRVKTEFDAKAKISRLEISDAVAEDSGEYTVKLTNEIGTTSAVIPVAVKESIARPQQKEETIVEEFQETKGKRGAITEEVTVKKKKKTHEEKTEVSEATKEVEEKVIKVKEIVTEIKEDKETKVKTQETSEEGSEYEYSEEEIELPLPVLKAKPEPTTVKEGETIRLTYKIANETEAKIQWSKNGQKLATDKDDRLKMGYDDKSDVYFLEVVEACFDDIGEYMLSAENEGGIIACTVSVNVVTKIEKKPPKLEEYPKPQIVREGSSIALACKVSGTPKPEVLFLKDGEPIKFDDEGGRIEVIYEGSICKLNVKEAELHDSGEYTITAINERGKICHTVTVGVQPQGVEYEDTGILPPEFSVRLQPVIVTKGEDVKLATTVKGTDVSVSWFKEGKPLKSDDKMKIGNEGDKHYLKLLSSTVQDSGEYTCTVTNTAGASYCTVNVTITEPHDADFEVVQKLSVKIEEERHRLSSIDGQEMLFKKYEMLDDYTCKDKKITLRKGSIVEVLDTEKTNMWLVRLEKDHHQVCYVPVELLLGKKEEEESSTEDEREEDEETPQFPIYTAIAQYKPSESDGLPLDEGDLVAVLDSKNPDKWLCDRVGEVKDEGWVPPSYLVAKSDDKLDTRRTQEVFREDIIKIKNKQQEAIMKRRYALKDLWESEKEYVRDLNFVMDSYFKAFEGKIPDELAGKRDIIFSTFPEIFNFHNEVFLETLMNCSNDSDEVASAFLNNPEQFQQYVPYFKNRNMGTYLIEREEPKKFLKEFDKSIGNVGENKLALPQYLSRPWDRLDEYIAILKDFLRYTAKAEQDVTKLEQAIKMLLDLRKQADDQSSLDHIVGYIGDLAELGPVIRHDDFLVWEGEAIGRGKERHLFLFKNKLLITRKRKAEDLGELPTYEFRGIIDLPETLLNEELSNDRRFELCFEDIRKGKYTFQAKTVPIKQAWCDLLRRWLCKWGTKPMFAAMLDKVTGKEGTAVKLRCKLEGQPLPEVTWHFNGQPIATSDKYNVISDLYEFFLVIPHATLDMSGRYTIKAKNKYGEEECSTILTVEEELVKPTFGTELNDCEVLLGADAKFACTVFGTPEAKVKWYKDGIELDSSERLKLISPDSKTFLLILNHIEEDDLGIYECRATNKAGTLSSKAKLIITDLEERKKECAPEFLSNFPDVLVVEGSEAKLQMRISGYPTPEVTWFFKGKLLKRTDYYDVTYNREKACLYIRIARPEHSGQYTCRVQNKFGMAEVTALVTVATKPVITSKFKDLERFIGESASFVCAYEGHPKPDVTWFHNKLALTDTERLRIEKSDNEVSLTITKILKHDDGEYMCRLINPAGEVSCFSKLFVQQPVEEILRGPITYAPSFTKYLKNREALAGSQTKFVCKAIGEPRPTSQWFKDGELVQPSDRIVVDTEDIAFRLYIRQVQEEDAGNYKCVLTNSAGEVSSTALLIVDTVKEDSTILSRKGKEKELREHHIPPMMSLDKPILQNIDYYNIEMSWQPAVLPPSAKQTPISYIIERKDLGRGSIADWVQVFSRIPDTTFKLTGYNPENDCLYRIRAENEFGISEPSMSSTHYGKPMDEIREDLAKAKREIRKERMPPRPPRDKPTINEIKDEDALELAWIASEFPEYAVDTEIFYIVERRCPPNKTWMEIASDIKDTTYIMKEYRPEKDYMFRIRAANDFGVSEPSLSATIFAKPEVEDRKVRDGSEFKSKVKPRTIWDKPEILDLTADSFKLKWKPSAVPNYAVQTPIWYIVEQRIPPNLDWTKIATDTKEPELKVTKYSPYKDYYFRVKAANEYGVAEPSMPVMLRKKEDVLDSPDEVREKKKKEKKETEIITLRHVPEHLRIVPEFLGEIDDVQYGVEGRTSRLLLRLRAYPEPNVTWYFHNNKIQMGDKFSSNLSDSGELVLQILDFLWTDVGEYKAHVENQFGIATRIIKMDMSDPPTFLEPMKDQVFHLHGNGRLECRVHGIPYPTVQFKKDWRPVAGSHRIKIVREEFDHWTLSMQNAIHMDEGVYECIAENIAGKVYCTANVKITEKTGIWRDIKFNSVPIEEYFHIIDELGRGSYGVLRRVIDKNSGNQYAAKFQRYNDIVIKDELMQELEMMSLLDHNNIAQIIDGYEDKKRLTIVMEIITGGELLQKLINEDTFRESDAAFYLRQLLMAVEYMHSKNVLHLDLKPENLLLSSPTSDEVKVIDFGFARRYNPTRRMLIKYGTPEFCAPEVVREESVTPAADLWSVGVIGYILLSGISPFHKGSPRDTLLKVQEGQWEFDSEAFADISSDAKDFIRRLLELDSKKRMSATEAMEHPFLDLANHRGLGNRISLDRHRAYMFRRKWERGASMVKTIVQPKLLSSYMLDTAVAPDTEMGRSIPVLRLPTADDVDQTSDSESAQVVEYGAAGLLQAIGPPTQFSALPSSVGSESSSEWGREYEDENTWYEFSSNYQTGPETHLFPSKDTGLSVRLAKYRRSSTKPRASSIRSSSMKERRDPRDLEKELEMEDVLPISSLASHRTIWQMKALSLKPTGYPPIFKEKIHDKAYNVGDSCTMKVHVVGNPMPLVSWYRNEELLNEGGRVRISRGDDGRHSFTVLQTKPNDFGVYKCVARNKFGTVTCRARMLCGDTPSRPGRPHVTKVSDREAFIIWEEPETDGNSYIQAYKVDWFRPGDERWTTATYCIDECALVKGLRADISYRFRICALNKFGQSPYSWASVEIRTKKKGTKSLDIDDETKRILLRTRQAASRPSPEPTPTTSPSESLEDLSEEAIQEKLKDLSSLDREIHLQETDPAKYLKFGSEIWRGRFSIVRNVEPKEGKKVKRLCKITLYNASFPVNSLREYDMLKALNQEHIVRLYEAYLWDDFVFLIFEKLYGENCVRSLSLKSKYDEHLVTHIIKQVLDALQFLHHRGIVHLNIQPDNVIMQSRRRFDVKLIDFGQANIITTAEGDKVEKTGTTEFMAPEKVCRENVGVAADVWGVGVLTFLLLSGVSPFYGEADEDTAANIKHVRYDANTLYHNVTKYAMKFLYQTLKRNPRSRLTVDECLEHRWLNLHQIMVKARKAATFPTDKLKLFLDEYITHRKRNPNPPLRLFQVHGTAAAFSTASDEEEEYFTNRRLSQIRS